MFECTWTVHRFMQRRGGFERSRLQLRRSRGARFNETDEYADRLRGSFGSHLLELRLFGSYARGEVHVNPRSADFCTSRSRNRGSAA